MSNNHKFCEGTLPCYSAINKRRGFIYCSFMIVCILCSALYASGNEHRPAFLGKDELVAGIAEYSRSLAELNSMRVKYRLERTDNFMPGKSLTATYGEDYSIVVGRKDRNWYCKIKGSQAENRFQHDVYNIIRSPHNLSFSFHDSENSPGHLAIDDLSTSDGYSHWLYTDHLFVNLSQFLPEPERKIYQELLSLNNPVNSPATYLYLPEALAEHLEKYRVLPQQETVHGIPCHVLEWTGHDKIWVSHERGFIPMKRNLYFGEDRAEGMLWKVVTQDDLEQMLPGLWLPRKQIVEFYPDPLHETDKAVWGKVGSRLHFAAEEIEINTLSDAFFQVAVPVGTRVQDFVNKQQYVVHSLDETPFESLVTIIKSDRPVLNDQAGKSNLLRWLLAVNGIAFLVVFLFWITRRTRFLKNGQA